ncbi:redoxin domain-containing protein [Roseiconus nitratireducens]|uniref:Redoxin domain-containing protein n=1 Tax=Roseiconus nitratireducens TaxID=2605748 RepID=A0A5M6CWX1_9BACT|nr:redoxin domain-containing protein [Roseiconus nitratireducens]KAA5539727.1 redoxin domain-containing protein [Roseiconus nitratireducens]
MVFRTTGFAWLFAITVVHIIGLSCDVQAATPSADPVSHAFSLPTVGGATVDVDSDDDAELTVVFFLSTECPLAKLYAPRLQRLADEYADSGLAVVGVASSAQDSVEDLRAFADEHEIRYPIAKDYGNEVADQFQAERTAEVVLLDDQLQVRYRGRIDNDFQPGVNRAGETRHDLKQAIDEALAGKEVSVAKTTPVGCLIGRSQRGEATTDVTFAKEVSRILNQHCVECHRRGEIGPFELTDYDEVVGWGPMMMEVIDQKRMPPWNADPEVGSFRNARQMPRRDKEILREWVEGGMPFGDAADLPDPSSPTPVATQRNTPWQLDSPPDRILEMSDRPFQVPADQTVEYQYYVVDPQLDHDVWIAGAQVIPGNRQVVHHCIVFIRPPDGFNARGIGWLTAYVPGQRGAAFPDGYARRIPAGSKLVFQMHYTPTGRPQEDLTRVGLWFAEPETVSHEVVTLTAINHDFEIPPHTADHVVTASRDGLPDDGILLAVAPHMHLRGKSFELFSQRGATKEKLLSVPAYDFNWQHVYAFEEPVQLSAVDRLSFQASFDNSSDNFANPDPSAHVFWGDQTDEEMAIAFFEVAIPRDAQRGGKRPASTGESAPANLNQQSKQVKAFVDDYFERFDQNRDGHVDRMELPTSVDSFGFKDLDLDGNGTLTRAEIARAASVRLAR